MQVEIPLADSWADAEAVADLQAQTGLVCHGRAYAPLQPVAPVASTAGSWPANSSIQQMDVQTYFFRRTNMNALGQPRSWTDHLLWHHAAHTVDLFATRVAARSSGRPRAAGTVSPDAGHRHGHVDPAEERVGAICTLSLSFNNDGPLGTFFRYIGDNGTYIARYDDLFNGKEEKIDVSMSTCR